MIAAEALSQFAQRLGEALHHPAELGTGSTVEGPVLRILVHAMSPAFDFARLPSRLSMEAQTELCWQFQLLLKGEAEGVLARTRLVEAAAMEICARPILEAEGWRADLALEADPEWARGEGPAVGVRMRVTAA